MVLVDEWLGVIARIMGRKQTLNEVVFGEISPKELFPLETISSKALREVSECYVHGLGTRDSCWDWESGTK